MIVLDLFAGIGGFSLAAHQMGWSTAQFVEREPFCQKVLTKNFPGVPIHDDIFTFSGTPLRGAVDIITGGFPCQPFSAAGKRKGRNDERHLFPEMLRVISEVRPRLVVAENVRGLLSIENGSVFAEVTSCLEGEGFEVLTFCLPASAYGAPHRRDRLWIVGRRPYDGTTPTPPRGCGLAGDPQHDGPSYGHQEAGRADGSGERRRLLELAGADREPDARNPDLHNVREVLRVREGSDTEPGRSDAVAGAAEHAQHDGQPACEVARGDGAADGEQPTGSVTTADAAGATGHDSNAQASRLQRRGRKQSKSDRIGSGQDHRVADAPHPSRERSDEGQSELGIERRDTEPLESDRQDAADPEVSDSGSGLREAGAVEDGHQPRDGDRDDATRVALTHAEFGGPQVGWVEGDGGVGGGGQGGQATSHDLSTPTESSGDAPDPTRLQPGWEEQRSDRERTGAIADTEPGGGSAENALLEGSPSIGREVQPGQPDRAYSPDPAGSSDRADLDAADARCSHGEGRPHEGESGEPAGPRDARELERSTGGEQPWSGPAPDGAERGTYRLWRERWIEVASRTCLRGVDDGLPGRVDQSDPEQWRDNRVARLKALGNSIAWVIAYEVFVAIEEADRIEGDIP